MPPTEANIAAATAMLGTQMGETDAEVVTDKKDPAAPPTGSRKSVTTSSPVPQTSEPARKSQTIVTKRGAGGKFERAVQIADGEELTRATKPEPVKAEAPTRTDAELRREKLEAQLANLREKNAERKTKSTHDQTAKQLADEKAELARERAAVAAEKAKWDAVEKNPVEGLRAMGRDVGEHFTQLAEAARTASSPEAKIAALQALITAQDEKFNRFQASLTEREQAAQRATQEREESAAKAHAVAELNAHVSPKAYPHARAYFNDEEIARLGDMYADRQRAKGITPSYESIAVDIEKTAKEHHATVLERLHQDAGVNGETSRQAITERTTGPATRTTAARTLTNDLASATASNGTRRKTLAERQQDAAKLLG